VLTGLLAALGGIILASQIGVGQADIGASTALTSIAMVVVGGTSLGGGEGGMWRTLVGFLTLAALANLFNSVNINSNWELLTEGVILIGAVAIDTKGRKGSRRQSRAILKRMAYIKSS
jgi:ribose/xylose/arabinose/galactoside ABC-type transport system permease subunit